MLVEDGAPTQSGFSSSSRSLPGQQRLRVVTGLQHLEAASHISGTDGPQLQ